MHPGHPEGAGMLCSVPPERDVGVYPAVEGDVGVEPAPLALSCSESTIKWCGVKAVEGSENVSPLTAHSTAPRSNSFRNAEPSPASSKEHREGLSSISTLFMSSS